MVDEYNACVWPSRTFVRFRFLWWSMNTHYITLLPRPDSRSDSFLMVDEYPRAMKNLGAVRCSDSPWSMNTFPVKIKEPQVLEFRFPLWSMNTAEDNWKSGNKHRSSDSSYGRWIQRRFAEFKLVDKGSDSSSGRWIRGLETLTKSSTVVWSSDSFYGRWIR